MTSKNESPTEISLEKSPSGIWGVPESPKLQPKSWQRLWLATTLVYLLMLAGTYLLLMPNQESIERKMVFNVTEEVLRYDGLAFAGESPRKIFESARLQGYDAWIAQIRSKYHIGPEGNAGFAKIDTNYREAISDLPVTRTIGIGLCIIAFILPMAALYMIGLIVDWFKRTVGIIRKG